MSHPCLLLLLLLSSAFLGPASANKRHVITFRSPTSPPSSLLYDPTSQHFLVGSASLPAATAVSDAGTLQTLLHDHDLPSESSFSSLSVDAPRRRLLAAVSSPSSATPFFAAYDLRHPHRRLFLSPLPSDEPGNSVSAVAVDPSTGVAYVTSSDSGIIWEVDLEGKSSVFSRSRAFGGGGLDGIAFVLAKGYLLAVQKRSGKVFRVDPDDGAARLVLMNKGIEGLDGVAVRSDGSAVVIAGKKVFILKSDDGWGEAVVYDEIGFGEGRRAMGVAVRDGRKAYVLHGEDEGDGGEWRIEEVESEREMGGEWVGALVMVGVGIAVFLYWRFQMRQLVTNMSKKVA